MITNNEQQLLSRLLSDYDINEYVEQKDLPKSMLTVNVGKKIILDNNMSCVFIKQNPPISSEMGIYIWVCTKKIVTTIDELVKNILVFNFSDGELVSLPSPATKLALFKGEANGKDSEIIFEKNEVIYVGKAESFSSRYSAHSSCKLTKTGALYIKLRGKLSNNVAFYTFNTKDNSKFENKIKELYTTRFGSR